MSSLSRGVTYRPPEDDDDPLSLFLSGKLGTPFVAEISDQPEGSQDRSKKHKGSSLSIREIQERKERAEKQYAQYREALSTQNQQALADLRGEHAVPSAAAGEVVDDDGDGDWVPVGDFLEGDEAFISSIRETVTRSIGHPRKYKDHRSWRRRLRHREANWAPIIPSLIDGYLTWKYPDAAQPPTSPSSSEAPPLAEAHPSDSPDVSMDGSPSYDFSIPCLDLYTLSTTLHVPRTAQMTTPVALALQGYLPSSPVSPRIAISMKTLELFHRLRLRKASFSVEAFAKVLCDLYGVPYRRRDRTALSDAFDIYLTILREVDKRVAAFLGRDTPNWRVLHSCPACTYELEEEPYLKFRRLIAIDGNNSLKRIERIGEREIADTRVFNASDYYLSDEYVNQFANKVKARSTQSNHAAVRTSAEAEAEPDTPAESLGDAEEGDPVDGATQVFPCADTWKNASADEKKQMWQVFLQCGIFAGACRHGLMLWIVDMVKSGELAKYPLAIVARALDILGDRLLIGYDIGCAFSSTIASSSLGEKFNSSSSRCCVNAFHGYSHNYLCQVHNHPNVIDGAGTEDLETMERIFSASNQLASVMRYASEYRRRVLIDLFFQQWDEDKYLNLPTFLYNNYKQALSIIEEGMISLEEAMASLQISSTDDLDKWHNEQTEYFSTLGQESEYDVHAVAYVELLQELADLNRQYENKTSSFMISTPSVYSTSTEMPTPAPSQTYSSELSKTRKLETERRHLEDRRKSVRQEILQFELKMGIEATWTHSSPEYIRTLQYLARRDYERALDNLQRLVVQRLFELHRINQSMNGYQMRTHIAKALQARSKAIQRAVKAYNTAAAQLTPRKEPIDWGTVSHFKFLEDFPHLRHTRNDILDRPWSSPAIRETIKQWQKICRAREEITRCDVEIRRLHTSILDEAHEFGLALQRCTHAIGPLSGAVKEFVHRRTRSNQAILAKLMPIYSLDKFSGNSTPGIRKGREPDVHVTEGCEDPQGVAGRMEAEQLPTASVLSSNSDSRSPTLPDVNADNSDSDSDEDDALQDDMVVLVDFVSQLTARD